VDVSQLNRPKYEQQVENFEWPSGYNYRMDIIYVDHAKQKRTIKELGDWLKVMITSWNANKII